MKPAGWLFLALCLATATLEASEIDWTSEFVHQGDDYRYSADSRYLLHLPADWSLLQTSEFEQRTDSDRLDRTGQYRWQIRKSYPLGGPLILFRYDRSLERDLHAPHEYAYRLRERAAGGGLDITPLPGMNLVTRWFCASLVDLETDQPDTSFTGLLEQTDLNLEREVGGHRLVFQARDQHAGYHPDRPNYDRAGIQYTANLPAQSLVSRLDVGRETERLRGSDGTSYHKSLTSASDYAVGLGRTRLRLRPTLSYDENRIDGRPEKNYAYRGGELRGDLSMPYGRTQIDLGLERELSDKDAELNSNSETFKRNLLETCISRGWGEGDSLSARYRIQLRQTDTPSGLTDNDCMNREFECGVYHHHREKISLSLFFAKYATQQVYLDSEMSGQNTFTDSYTLQPGVDLDCGGGFYIGQTYRLRADYEDHEFPGMGPDRYFRRFQGTWRWGYDDSPGLRRISLSGHAVSSREGTLEPMSVWAEYSFSASDAGSWSGDAYVKVDERFQHQAAVQASLDGRKIDWRLGGRMDWVATRREGRVIQSRREGRPEFAVAYHPIRDSEAALTLQPVFYNTIRPDWRVSFRLTVHR
jgi:hypothetical protein